MSLVRSLVRVGLVAALAGAPASFAQGVSGDDIHFVPRPSPSALDGSNLLPALGPEYRSLELIGALGRVEAACQAGKPIPVEDQRILDQHAVLWETAFAASLERAAGDESIDALFDEVVVADGAAPGLDPLHLREVAGILRGLSTDAFEYEMARSLMGTGTTGYAQGYRRSGAAAPTGGLGEAEQRSLSTGYFPAVRDRLLGGARRLQGILGRS